MKLLLTTATALVASCCLVGVVNCGEKECESPGIGRIVSVRNGCTASANDTTAATCPIQLDWVPGTNHDSLHVRLLVLKNGTWTPIIEGLIPDTKFTTEQQYTSEITLERSKLPSPPEVRVEIYQPEKVEVCKIVD